MNKLISATLPLIKQALKEDKAFTDITTLHTVGKEKTAVAVLTAKAGGIICGTDIFAAVFKYLDKRVKITKKVTDGKKVKYGDIILTLSGPARAILSGERTALNFLQHLSGIATLTNHFVKIVKGTKTKIYDTRKTVPGFRLLAKYAVKTGGGENHRLDLSDMALIKDNHLSLIKDLTKTVSEIHKKTHKKVQVECENLAQIPLATAAKADLIMLDNMSFATMKKAVALIRKNSSAKYKPEIEISGGVDTKMLKKYASLGIERISVGKITHSAPALDISLRIKIK
jgi:nicotinate-nucleotide pyrophosphorylase (carboxylating)